MDKCFAVGSGVAVNYNKHRYTFDQHLTQHNRHEAHLPTAEQILRSKGEQVPPEFGAEGTTNPHLVVQSIL